GGELSAKDLQPNRPLVLEIAGEIDSRHPPATELALDGIAVAQGLSQCRSRPVSHGQVGAGEHLESASTTASSPAEGRFRVVPELCLSQGWMGGTRQRATTLTSGIVALRTKVARQPTGRGAILAPATSRGSRSVRKLPRSILTVPVRASTLKSREHH